MKWILGSVFLVAGLAAVSCTVCSTADDCKEGYCCLALTSTQLWRRGYCIKLSRKYNRCSTPDMKLDSFGGKYSRYCPCQEDLSCEPLRLKQGETDLLKIRSSLRCQKPTQSRPETTTAPELKATVPEELIDFDIKVTDADKNENSKEVNELIKDIDDISDDFEDKPDDDDMIQQQGPGGDPPRKEDPDCEDWTYGC